MLFQQNSLARLAKLLTPIEPSDMDYLYFAHTRQPTYLICSFSALCIFTKAESGVQNQQVACCPRTSGCRCSSPGLYSGLAIYVNFLADYIMEALYLRQGQTFRACTPPQVYCVTGRQTIDSPGVQPSTISTKYG